MNTLIFFTILLAWIALTVSADELKVGQYATVGPLESGCSESYTVVSHEGVMNVYYVDEEGLKRIRYGYEPNPLGDCSCVGVEGVCHNTCQVPEIPHGEDPVNYYFVLTTDLAEGAAQYDFSLISCAEDYQWMITLALVIGGVLVGGVFLLLVLVGFVVFLIRTRRLTYKRTLLEPEMAWDNDWKNQHIPDDDDINFSLMDD